MSHAGPNLLPLPARSDIPPEVQERLVRVRDELVAAGGADLAALILYGGLARGRYRPGRSDANILIVLHNASAAVPDALLAPLRQAFRALRVEPMILTLAELQATADSFPTKFLDIQGCHVVLAGADPLPALNVSPERVRWVVAQSLRNLALRLRRRYVAVGGDTPAMSAALEQAARPLAIDLQFLLRLNGRQTPDEDHTTDIFAAAATAFALDAPALARLAQLRQNDQGGDDLGGLYNRVVRTIVSAADLAGRGTGDTGAPP